VLCQAAIMEPGYARSARAPSDSVAAIASKASTLIAMRIMRSGPAIYSRQPFFVFTPQWPSEKRWATVALHIGQTQTKPGSW
jgi:hypothetical protein